MNPLKNCYFNIWNVKVFEQVLLLLYAGISGLYIVQNEQALRWVVLDVMYSSVGKLKSWYLWPRWKRAVTWVRHQIPKQLQSFDQENLMKSYPYSLGHSLNNYLVNYQQRNIRKVCVLQPRFKSIKMAKWVSTKWPIKLNIHHSAILWYFEDKGLSKSLNV